MSVRTQRGNLLAQLFISLALLIGAVGIFANRQQLSDQVVAWQFRPSASIASIADRAAFSDHGELLFFASQPQLLSREPFNEACRSVATEHTAVLGCYAANRIYLFDITNHRLDGIKEVTAAHEMLHAAYQRLSAKERDRVNQLLENQSFGADEERIVTLLGEYEKTEPGERYNELHSILGSELETLTPELEAYYAQYFTDRGAVVKLAKSYQAVFDELKSRQEGLVGEINRLADEIDDRGSVYRRNIQVLEADIRSFNAEASSGTMSRETYETQRAALERRQTLLSSERDDLQTLIDRYESLRSELAAINSESAALNRSINSSVAPVQEAIDG